jgi:hypothetical protein
VRITGEHESPRRAPPANDVHPEAIADCDLAFQMLSSGIER